jgi:hypothetical protein
MSKNSGVPHDASAARRQGVASATVALAGLGYFVVVVSLLHFLRQDYEPMTRFLSKYAVGRYGFLMSSALLALGVASFALAHGLNHAVKQVWSLKMGLAFLLVWSIGLLTAGLFVSDLQDAPRTTTGMIHDAAALFAFLCIPVAAILLAVSFQRDERWRRFYRRALVLAALVALGLFMFFVSFEIGAVGFYQRIFVGLVLLWMLLVALRLRSESIYTSS